MKRQRLARIEPNRTKDKNIAIFTCGDQKLVKNEVLSDIMEGVILTETKASSFSGRSVKPVYTLKGSNGGMYLGTSLSKTKADAIVNQHGATLAVAAHVTHTVLQRLWTKLLQNKIKLSTREVECMLWLSRGERPHAIANRLKLARVTVDLHIRNAKKKLDAKTREQAVVKAVFLGIVTP